jgi:hypothetical protein
VSMVEEVIPDSLIKQIRELAECEGVTVEQFISSSEQCGRGGVQPVGGR